ncbi:MAG: thioredoxin [Candidatus Pelagibacterales bacterium]|nr:MAG: thioredoxin [Pelagibacterales bacterium]
MKKIFLIFFLLLSTNAFSSEEQRLNFTVKTFEEAKKNGETIVVTAWNKYCGTCKKQKVVLDQAEKDFKNVLFLYYSHPKMKDVAKYLKIDHRSTILVYKGNEEVSRTIGQVDRSSIYTSIQKGV